MVEGRGWKAKFGLRLEGSHKIPKRPGSISAIFSQAANVSTKSRQHAMAHRADLMHGRLDPFQITLSCCLFPWNDLDCCTLLKNLSMISRRRYRGRKRKVDDRGGTERRTVCIYKGQKKRAGREKRKAFALMSPFTLPPRERIVLC